MTTSVVVGCILLAGDELLRVEQLSVGACTHLICGISFSDQIKSQSFIMLQFVFVQFTTGDTATKLNSINKKFWHTPLQFWRQYLLLHKSILRYCFWTYKAVWGKSRQHLMNGDRYIYLGCSKCFILILPGSLMVSRATPGLADWLYLNEWWIDWTQTSENLLQRLHLLPNHNCLVEVPASTRARAKDLRRKWAGRA